MISRYRISRLTGPSGVFAGYLLFIFGIASVYFTWTSIPVIIIGAAMAFSYSVTLIDFGSKRFKPALMLFGFIPLGSWSDLDPADQVSVKQMKGSYSAFSRGNRQSFVSVSDYRVILLRDSDKKKVTLARFDTQEGAAELVNKVQIMMAGD
jgi:hypothetical protein